MNNKNEVTQLLSQAKQEARSEGFKKFLQNHFKIIFTIFTASLVLGIGVFVFTFYQKSQQEKFSEILHQSIIYQQSGNLEKAKENLKKIYDKKSAPAGVWSLSSLRYAAFLLSEGKKVESEEVYQEINNCRTCNNYVKDLSGLLLVKLWMSDESEVKKEDLSTRIEKIEHSASTLKYYISEQRAFLEMQKNNLEKSYQIFDLITKNPEISPVLKARANDGLRMISEKGFEPKIDDKKSTEKESSKNDKSLEKAEKIEEKEKK